MIGNGDLLFHDVTCRFDDRSAGAAGRPALEHLSLRAGAGEITCLVGPNGAGKSTALAAAAGLVPVREGGIEYSGRPVRIGEPPPEMGYLPQSSVFPTALTVGEILDFSFAVRATIGRDRRAVLAVLGLEDRSREPVGTLSSGWRRRLGLAVALIPGSRLFLLDEPFVGLDLRVLDALVAHLTGLAKAGATVLLSSHDFEIIDLLRARMAILDEGCLVAIRASAGIGSRAAYRRALDVEGEVEDANDEEESHELAN